MINSIAIASEASFASAPQTLDNLSKFNFIYGGNGSGKTTISRVIENVDGFPSCSIDWTGGAPLEPRVYNQAFIDSILDEDTNIKGIFTLGKDAVKTRTRIKVLKEKYNDVQNSISSLRENLGDANEGLGVYGQLKENKEEAVERLWGNLSDLRDHEHLRGAFEGTRGSKPKFFETLLDEAENNQIDIPEREKILESAKTVFGPEPEKREIIPSVEHKILSQIETDPILEKKIVGSKDVDLSNLINKLENSDWVKEGRDHLHMSQGVCPFCQQRLPEGFEAKLEQIFDQAFEEDLGHLRERKLVYQQSAEQIISDLEGLIKEKSPFIEHDNLRSQKTLFDTLLSENFAHLKAKEKSPSVPIILKSTQACLDQVANLISDANQKIEKHNNMVDNLDAEKIKLTAQAWRLAAADVIGEVEFYLKKKSGLEQAAAKLELKIKGNEQESKRIQNEISELEKTITSTQPTIDGINNLLNSYGFTGFKLDRADEGGNYMIIREDGRDARSTLSEGERHFIAFLYFFNLLKGSESKAGTLNDRIVVFDDPVSSLDSDVLFVVSSLIRSLFKGVNDGTSAVKQIFVLTHNIYFHRQVTYRNKRSNLGRTTFWVVQKTNGVSQVEYHENNPIKSSYELLWRELQDGGRSTVAIRNTIRRILEHYFTILGGIDFDDLVDNFDGDEKVICQSLVSWLHDGSHSVGDDAYFSPDAATTEKYLEVFKEVFIKLGHKAHYDMMINDTLPAVTA